MDTANNMDQSQEHQAQQKKSNKKTTHHMILIILNFRKVKTIMAAG